MSSVPLKRIGGLAKAAVILTIAIGVVAVLSLLAALAAVDDARDFLDDRISEDDFNEAYAPALALGGVQGVTTIALVVITMIWMYRIAANHRTLGRIGTWSPGWAIGGWFLPPLVLYIIPFLMFRELWRAADPAVPIGDDAWKRRPVSPVVPVWWVLYGLGSTVVFVWQIVEGLQTGGLTSSDMETSAEALDENFAVTVAAALVSVSSAAAFVLLVRGLSARHRALTGEATTPR